jgi:hypothetical protein
MFMDWYTIEYLYPLSFNKFKESMFPNTGIVSLTVLEHYDLKKLYSFFDNHKIYLIIENLKPSQWAYTISTNDIVFGPGDFQNSREKIEENGFTECFRTLEKMLAG